MAFSLFMAYSELFKSPASILTREQVLSEDCIIPDKAGVYGWYFKNFPNIIPTSDCIKYKDSTLLYVGISPSRPPKNGKLSKRQGLKYRIRNHMKGNAYGSTLRLSMGCLLSEELKINLQRVGKNDRKTFADGEQKLSQWFDENASVTWFTCDNPWDIETDIFTELSLPLNLMHNGHHVFHPYLSEARRLAKQKADQLNSVK